GRQSAAKASLEIRAETRSPHSAVLDDTPIARIRRRVPTCQHDKRHPRAKRAGNKPSASVACAATAQAAYSTSAPVAAGTHGDPPCVIRCAATPNVAPARRRSEEHTSELQSLAYLVCRLL